MNIDLGDAFLCEEEAGFYEEELKRRHFPTRYNFLKSHNGFRKGNVHVFLGTSGGGKTTLIRTILIDLLHSLEGTGKFILLWLSEERKKDYVRELLLSGIPYNLIKKIKIYSEVDNHENGSKDVLKKLEWITNEMKPLAVVYDNITTSIEYATKAVPVQDHFFSSLKKMANSSDIPFIVTAHTNSSIGENYDGIIDQNDIRGSKMPVMLSEFFYILQSFYIGEKRFNTIRITKFRGNPVEARLFELMYCKESRIFREDKKMDFTKFSEVYKNRNKIK